MLNPRGATPGICGAFDFQKIFRSKSPPWGPKTGSNQIKYPHLGEVISLKFIVVVVYILQIIDINCQAFLLTPLMLCVILWYKIYITYVLEVPFIFKTHIDSATML